MEELIVSIILYTAFFTCGFVVGIGVCAKYIAKTGKVKTDGSI